MFRFLPSETVVVWHGVPSGPDGEVRQFFQALSVEGGGGRRTWPLLASRVTRAEECGAFFTKSGVEHRPGQYLGPVK